MIIAGRCLIFCGDPCKGLRDPTLAPKSALGLPKPTFELLGYRLGIVYRVVIWHWSDLGFLAYGNLLILIQISHHLSSGLLLCGTIVDVRKAMIQRATRQLLLAPLNKITTF